MAAIGGEDDARRIGLDRARGGLELAVEKFVEACKGIRRIGELRGIDAVALDERVDARGGLGGIHAPAVPCGEKRALHKRVQGDRAERAAIGPAQESLAVDLLGLE